MFTPTLWAGSSIVQSEGDLGDRMLNCFAKLRAQGYEKIALIGSDSPDLPVAYLQQVFELLDSTEMVIGGGPDSGFYLIGASVVPPKINF